MDAVKTASSKFIPYQYLRQLQVGQLTLQEQALQHLRATVPTFFAIDLCIFQRSKSPIDRTLG